MSEGVREDGDGDGDEDVCGLALHSDLIGHPEPGAAPAHSPSPSSQHWASLWVGTASNPVPLDSQSGRGAAPLQG